jgi:hypothetical protein
MIAMNENGIIIAKFTPEGVARVMECGSSGLAFCEPLDYNNPNDREKFREAVETEWFGKEILWKE